ncbi:MAG: sprT domain-containing protein, partial [Bacteroidetes bacterium]|nr:sprT domain-containing protein [Bacteroidota bacterium]
TKAIRKYDKDGEKSIFLDELPDKAIFQIKNQKQFIFQKGEKARTRYKCLEMKTKREYWVTAHAEVLHLKEN